MKKEISNSETCKTCYYGEDVTEKGHEDIGAYLCDNTLSPIRGMQKKLMERNISFSKMRSCDGCNHWQLKNTESNQASEHTKGSSTSEELAIAKLERLRTQNGVVADECNQCKKLKSLLRDAVDWAKCGNYLTEIDDDSRYKRMRLERGIGKSYKITVNLIRAIFNKATASL